MGVSFQSVAESSHAPKFVRQRTAVCLLRDLCPRIPVELANATQLWICASFKRTANGATWLHFLNLYMRQFQAVRTS